jgi:hypothetical protein
MSADLITEIQIRGTKEEIMAILQVVRYFENEKYEQYKEKRDCPYIQSVRISSNGKSLMTKGMSDNDIDTFISDSGNEVNLSANGPFGVYYMLEDVGLFEAISVAAPTAAFSGSSDGYITGASVALTGELLNGTLYLRNYYEADEDQNEEPSENMEFWDPVKRYDPKANKYF